MISVERKEKLVRLIDYVQGNIDLKKEMNLNFICTHNSRRSHLAQIWAQVGAWMYGIPNLRCYSGGTEATAMFPMIAETLIYQGLQVHQLSNEANPVYVIKCSFSEHPIITFSKKYDHFFNPSKNFAAVMTCGDADDNCPLIPEASARISLPYEDPKIYDGTKEAVKKYRERSGQIKEEMFYIMENIRQ